MCEHGITNTVKLYKPREFSKTKEVEVDYCIAPLIQIMNDYGIETLGSCCGHGKYQGSIIIKQENKQIEIKLPFHGLERTSTGNCPKCGSDMACGAAPKDDQSNIGSVCLNTECGYFEPLFKKKGKNE